MGAQNPVVAPREGAPATECRLQKSLIEIPRKERKTELETHSHCFKNSLKGGIGRLAQRIQFFQLALFARYSNDCITMELIL